MIGVELDAGIAVRTTLLWPKSMKKKMGDAIERIGRKFERDAKVYAPIISGNLRRQIDFKRQGMTGEVRAKANYSAFVHGAPYHNGGFRRTTPFFTLARDNNRRFAQREIDNAVKRSLTSSIKK